MEPTKLYEMAQERYLEINKFCQAIEKRMKKYPDGKIHIVRRGKVGQYYLRIDPKDKSGTYIVKNEKDKIKTYLQKKYDQEVFRHLKSEKSNLEEFINKSRSISDDKIRKIYSESLEEVKNMIIPIDISNKDYKEKWLNAKLETKEINPHISNYITNRGERVRSKSELTIANALDRYGIPYKYECPLLLSNGVTIHPDFTILNVKTRKEYYWEHRGMMDDRDYARHAVNRLKELGREGIALGDNLIISEETTNCPLGTDEIDRIIKRLLI